MKVIGMKIRMFLFSMLLLAGNLVMGQATILMPVSGHKDTTLTSCVLYDDGGATGNHSAHTNASYTFHTTNSNNRFRITVNSYLNNCNEGLASLKIYCVDTINNDSTLLDGWVFACNVAWFTYSTTNVITVVFKADDDNAQQGFQIKIDEAGCEPATNVTATFTDTNTAVITWDEPSEDIHWVIDYTTYFVGEDAHLNFANNDTLHTVYSDTNYVIITNLDAHSFYSFNVYPQCNTYSGNGKGYLTSACPCVFAQNLTMTYDEDSIYLDWDNPLLHNIEWTVSDDTHDFFHEFVTTTHWAHAIPSTCDSLPEYISVVGNCDYKTGHFGKAFQCNGTYVYAKDILCTTGIISYNVNSVTASSIEVVWSDNSCPSYNIYYRLAQYPEDSNIFFKTVTANENTTYYFETVTGLKEATSYIVSIVYPYCTLGTTTCYNTASITANTSLDNCIDYINLYSNKTKLQWGTYNNPDADSNHNNYRIWWNYADLGNKEANNYLHFWGTDRHTPIVDTNLYDWRTNNLLRCVPPTEKASMKLGNDNANSEAESIIYDYYVDTTDKDMLVLKYAVVLEDPNHTRLNQPRFTLEILDSNNNLIDSTCCYADFYAAGDLGWNTVEGTNVIWKDWTTVGIDIAPYNGQNIKIKLSTYDCAEGGHFGYAYFTVGCDNKRIYLLNRCDGVDSIWLQAPLGFEYQWTKLGDNTILSTDFEVKVPVDTNTYQCLASFVGKPECNFTITTVSVNVESKAIFNVSIDTCQSTATFINSSFLKMDTTYGSLTKQFVDSIYWVFEDGSIHYGDTITRHFDTNGYYRVTLYCLLSESQCVDSMVSDIHVDFADKLYIVGDSNICIGQMINLSVEGREEQSNISYLWNTGDTTAMISVTPNDDTTFSCEITLPGGCQIQLDKHINAFLSYNDTITADICDGETFDSLNFHENQSGVYQFHLYTSEGCDSVTTLLLTVHPQYDTTLSISTCDTDYVDENFYMSQTGVYTHTFASEYGCDSVVTINFTRLDVFKDTIKAEIYKGDTFTDYGFEAYESGTYEQVYQDTNGCDSTYILDLKVVDFHFPNVVTPNGDGVNDVYDIHDLVEQQMFSYTVLRIYNRYGKLIFEKENIHSAEDRWDPDETNSPSGTYFYRFNARSNTKTIDVTGTIEVLREK